MQSIRQGVPEFKPVSEEEKKEQDRPALFDGSGNIIEKKNHNRVYSPIRIAGFASEEADRLNDCLMDFSKEELKVMISNIKEHIKKVSK